MKGQEGDTPFAAAGGRWYNLYDTPILTRIVKVQTSIDKDSPQDSIPQKSTSRGQGRYEISSISAEGKSSDKLIYWTLFMPMCMFISV